MTDRSLIVALLWSERNDFTTSVALLWNQRNDLTTSVESVVNWETPSSVKLSLIAEILSSVELSLIGTPLHQSIAVTGIQVERSGAHQGHHRVEDQA